ncbi:MAG: ribosome biogenesis GTPase Der [Acidobacteriales bacterium]|nr:ribosome biogenesis GTPase Der [Terriglobales bacterium]
MGNSRVCGSAAAWVGEDKRRVDNSSYNSQLPSTPPTLVIVGRPNVGKSTLFNRLIGSRRSIVGDEPGITRDRIYGTTEWNGATLRVIDTGGIIPEDKETIPAEIFRQAKVAFDEASAIVMVVDGRAESASPDFELARLLRRLNKPVFLAVNKIDSAKLEPQAESFRELGLQELFPISAEHGNGVGDLLDAVVEAVGVEEPAKDEWADDVELRDSDVSEDKSFQPPAEMPVAIIGRPNVGKSTLLNALTNTERAIVSPIAGTTRDAVDELVTRPQEEMTYRLIDTAGIRRKGKTHLMAEKLSVVMARKHLESAEIALLVIDAVEGVTASDATIGGYAHESGRSVIVVINKWDLVEAKADRAIFEEQARRVLKFLEYAPMVFVSAAQGAGTEQLFKQLALVARERYKRVSTGEMNRFLETVDFERASVPANRKLRIKYMTQAQVAPPTFVLFTDRDVPLHFSYKRFLENQIRRAFGFVGAPIWIKNRAGRRM